MNTSKARTPPQGELSLRVVAMPADTNLSGQVFGGWVLGHRWICPGSIHAVGRQPGERVVTIALEAMMFHKPVHVGGPASLHPDRAGWPHVDFGHARNLGQT